MSERVVGGRYRLQQQLGRGGMASVWKAQDMRLDRMAAVKVLDPASRADPVALERLRREALMVARLAHQNLVSVYDVDVDSDSDVAYMAMELVEGNSLAELLAVHGRLPVQQAAAIAAQVCDALGSAHEAGVIHRDIKPANILIDPAGTVKVCDFGIALLHKSIGEASLTRAGTVVGTCQFMAPEQATGKPVDARTDLYALGCVLYTMLAGSPPFNADNPIDVLRRHLEEPPAPLRAHREDIPPDLDRLVRELLEKHPAHRPATAWSVRDRLRAVAGAPQATVVTTLVTPTAPDISGRHRSVPIAERTIGWIRQWISGWVALLAGAAVLTTLLAVVVLANSGQPDATAGHAPPSSAAPPSDTATATATADRRPPRSANRPAHPTLPNRSTPTTPPPPRVAPLDQIIGLAGAVQKQADNGQLTSKAARELLRSLDDVTRTLRAGDTGEATERFADFRDRVTELRQDDKLSQAGYDALPDLDRIAASLGTS